jgi:hypothetical protein
MNRWEIEKLSERRNSYHICPDTSWLILINVRKGLMPMLHLLQLQRAKGLRWLLKLLYTRSAENKSEMGVVYANG